MLAGSMSVISGMCKFQPLFYSILFHVAMADSDTVKGLLYACLAFVGLLITITIFLIYTLVFRVKRAFVYHISFSDTQAHPHSDTADLRVAENSVTAGESETVENRSDTEDDKDTDSLTRNLSFSKFDMPQQPKYIANGENITESEEPLEHSENTENPEIAENKDVVDDDKESDIMTRGLSFSTFDKLIEDASTTKVLETTEFLETAGHPTIQEEEPGTPECVKDTGSLTRTEQPGSSGVAGDSETISEIYIGIPDIDDSTEGTYNVTKGVLVSIDQQPDDTVHGEGIKESDEPLRPLETTENLQIIENEEAVDDDKESDIMTRGLTFSTFDKLIEHASTTKIMETTELLEITEHPTIYERPNTVKADENANNNSNNTAPAISSSKQREDKQVSFSGNDSTYIVERKEKSVQLMQYDETSNFEFVKFVRQQQKKT